MGRLSSEAQERAKTRHQEELSNRPRAFWKLDERERIENSANQTLKKDNERIEEVARYVSDNVSGWMSGSEWTPASASMES